MFIIAPGVPCLVSLPRRVFGVCTVRLTNCNVRPVDAFLAGLSCHGCHLRGLLTNEKGEERWEKGMGRKREVVDKSGSAGAGRLRFFMGNGPTISHSRLLRYESFPPMIARNQNAQL